MAWRTPNCRLSTEQWYVKDCGPLMTHGLVNANDSLYDRAALNHHTSTFGDLEVAREKCHENLNASLQDKCFPDTLHTYIEYTPEEATVVWTEYGCVGEHKPNIPRREGSQCGEKDLCGTGSLSGHPSKQQPRSTLLDPNMGCGPTPIVGDTLYNVLIPFKSFRKFPRHGARQM
ncbi:hypothetical protein J6590_011333 [Homalodisca vitripennis]|nr:hypothetical protein J6590_011333 [Homalodisca vitripennis]